MSIRFMLAAFLAAIPLVVSACSQEGPSEKAAKPAAGSSPTEVQQPPTPKENAWGPALSGKVVLSVKDANWTEAVLSRDSPPQYIDVTGKAGVGATEEEAQANLTPIKTEKDFSGKQRIFIDLAKPFQGKTRFYLKISAGRLLLDLERPAEQPSTLD